MRWPRPPEFECTVKSDAIGAPVASGSVGPRLEQAKFGIPAPACDVAGCMSLRRGPRCSQPKKRLRRNEANRQLPFGAPQSALPPLR